MGFVSHLSATLAIKYKERNIYNANNNVLITWKVNIFQRISLPIQTIFCVHDHAVPLIYIDRSTHEIKFNCKISFQAVRMHVLGASGSLLLLLLSWNGIRNFSPVVRNPFGFVIEADTKCVCALSWTLFTMFRSCWTFQQITVTIPIQVNQTMKFRWNTYNKDIVLWNSISTGHFRRFLICAKNNWTLKTFDGISIENESQIRTKRMLNYTRN